MTFEAFCFRASAEASQARPQCRLFQADPKPIVAESIAAGDTAVVAVGTEFVAGVSSVAGLVRCLTEIASHCWL